MKANEVMTKKIISVDKNSTVSDAAKKMSEADVGSVLVNDQDDLVGIITDRDIAVRGVAKDTDLKSTCCNDIMTQNVVTAHSDSDMKDVMGLMSQHQIKRVPITDKKKVVGMVSLKDISQNIDSNNTAGDLLSDITD